MGLDINSQGFGQQNLDVSINLGSSQNESSNSSQSTGGSNPANTNLSATLNTDEILPSRTSNTSSSSQNSSNMANNPSLSNPSGTSTSTVSSQISTTIKERNLPDGKDLADKVSDTTKQTIQSTVKDLGDDHALDSEMKNFFNLLSKLYPLSLTLLDALLKGGDKKNPDEIAKQTIKVLGDLGKTLGEHIDKLDIPKEMKDQLKNLASQLANLGTNTGDPSKLTDETGKLLKSLQTLTGSFSNGGEMEDLAQTLTELAKNTDGATLKNNPDLFQKLGDLGLLSKNALQNQFLSKDELATLMSQMQKNGQGGELGKMFQTLTTTLNMLQTLNGLPKPDKSLGLSSFLAMQNIDSSKSPSGLIGPKLGELSSNAAKFILSIQDKGGALAQALPRGAEGEKLYTSAFSQVMLSAAVLGRMIAESKAGGITDDSIKVAILKLNSAKDLGIVDQIPFSFMAFFADLTSNDDNLSDAVKEAKASLLHLIRLLLKLIFILVAIASAGTKLGAEGMDKLLAENALFITGILDALIFALKKVDENYVVNVKFHSALLQKGKDSLAVKDYPEFWVSMLQMFNEKTELVQFLKDMEDAKPLFTTLESMISESGDALPVNIPIAT